METTTSPKRLYRSETYRYIAGVAGGLGEYANLDPLLFRLAFIILSFASGAGIILYLLCWLLIPLRSQETDGAWDEARFRRQATQMAQEFDAPWKSEGSARWLWTALVVIGALLIVGFFAPIIWGLLSFFWPLIFIVIGWRLLVRKRS